MVERSPDGRALRQVRNGGPEDPQVLVHGRHNLFHRVRGVRDECIGIGATINPAGRGASSDAGDAVPPAAIRLSIFIRDYLPTRPPSPTWKRSALGCDSDGRDM